MQVNTCAEIEQFGKAIGNTTRYNIVQELAKGPLTVGQIIAQVGGSQSSVSQHLKVLKVAGVVLCDRRGLEMCYRLNTEYTLQILKSITGNFDKKSK